MSSTLELAGISGGTYTEPAVNPTAVDVRDGDGNGRPVEELREFLMTSLGSASRRYFRRL